MSTGYNNAYPMDGYLVPAQPARFTLEVHKSRFIASLAPASSVEEARSFIASTRQEFPDAHHWVPAYIIGHGQSSISHCSDDGEPPGSAGRPSLTVLSGSGLGDVVVVTARYFGGTKLGVGGLVRAYSEAVRGVLAQTPRARKVAVCRVSLGVPYPAYERVTRLIASYEGEVLEQEFAEQVVLRVQFEENHYPAFQAALQQKAWSSVTLSLVDRQIARLATSSRRDYG